jgi:alkanesulfonate monooxygenase SsuD/methylene tetrahydromethanopterin reductase-like flavin-dependent oxidoreductase (luciferase family)
MPGTEVPWIEFGAHLPLMTWGNEEPASLADLTAYTRLANELGLGWLTANDHLVYGRPWLDGPVALASVLPAIGTMTVATTIALPVVRGPGPLAKALAAIDRLSGGKLVVGVGPGSSEQDYGAVGIAWEERWPRFEEAVQALRALLRPASEPFGGAFYPTEGMRLLPAATQPGGPPIWMGSWGSNVGLRRVARLADGWLASGYNTTPEAFAEASGACAGICDRKGSTRRGSPTRS